MMNDEIPFNLLSNLDLCSELYKCCGSFCLTLANNEKDLSPLFCSFNKNYLRLAIKGQKAFDIMRKI